MNQAAQSKSSEEILLIYILNTFNVFIHIKCDKRELEHASARSNEVSPRVKQMPSVLGSNYCSYGMELHNLITKYT